ncbi:Protein transport protein S9 plasma membrane t-SNARE [Entomophthora muscae]|uniref:Protein transport protein S9 plasma membrane t-SNARE n=1 Tax=Entomophthora muscae TaxID=34485 RepID=A0ACC2RQF0_9FUNG|nr:Protein transport protein S9 plasma membrane t-SNARE [Entomophthora muscae]
MNPPTMLEKTPPAPQEDESIDSLKTQIRSVKQSSLAATRNAVTKLAESEDVAANTLERLGRQSDKINSIDRQLEMADAQADAALEQSKELKKVNGSMFSGFRIRNPFKSRPDPTKIDKLKAAHQAQLEQEESLRAERQASMGSNLSDQASPAPSSGSKASLGGPNSQYNFEEDEEGLNMEKEIDSNLDSISSALGRLKNMSLAMTDEIDNQNTRLDKINENASNVETKVAAGRDRLKKIG